MQPSMDTETLRVENEEITNRLLGSNHFAHRRFSFGLALFDYRVLWSGDLDLGVAEEAWLR